MRLCTVVLCCAAGCATIHARVHMALQLQGTAAGPAEQQRCLDAATRAGVVVDQRASVQAVVTLDPAGGRLQVVTMRRGLVRDESKPAGSVELLCTDAANTAAAMADTAPADWSGGTPSPEQPPRNPTTSGGDYHGPISN
jgi:hypothetical protein